VDETPTDVRLQRFPVGPARIRVYRWLARRRIVTGITWYVGILIPALVLTVLAARVHDLLGVTALIAGGIGVVVGLLRLRRIVTDCGDLVERVATVRDANLVIEPSEHIDLRSGRTTVLEPGAVRGYGRAHLLMADGRPCLLLSDPRTSAPRAADDLDALVVVLQTSPHQRDLDTARRLSRLSAPRPRTEPAAAGKPPLVWRAVDALAWTVLVFAVAPSVMLAAGALSPGSPGQSEGMTGPLLGLVGLALLLIWVIYLFTVVYVWIGMAWLTLTGTRSGRS
jgi:hypothetical protein